MKLSVASILLLAAPGVLGFSPTSIRSKASTSLFAEKYKVFIDGEAGTTGIQVRGRLEKREDLEIISPPSDLRKDVDTRKKFINDADVVILCTFEFTEPKEIVELLDLVSGICFEEYPNKCWHLTFDCNRKTVVSLKIVAIVLISV